MKRKIAAILAADIAGYSKLVADDEEETIARLGGYRQVFDELIQRFGGRIFNTAGDAVMAEFSSAVEAVRCAVDVQESLRTRNLAYPPSRQMHFRIGISIGDVIERDGDLLGDGVNIAARLEGLAAPGGICVSRSVFEQVSNKVSIKFADIGEQLVKNIPTPVHAYMVGETGDVPVAAPAKPPAASPARSTILLMAAGVAILAIAGGAYWALRDAPATGRIGLRAAIQFEGLMECEKLAWTAGPYRGQARVSVKDGVAEFERGVFGVDGRRFTGNESGKGTISPEGDVRIMTSYVGGNTNRIDGVFTGRLRADGGILTGQQVAVFGDQRQERSCTVTLKKA